MTVFNALFTTLPYSEIFKYFNDYTLHQCNSVNRQFQQLSQNHYSNNYTKLKKFAITYNLLKAKQTEKDFELKECTEEIKNKKQEQQTLKNTWLGYFVSKFNSSNRLISKISNLLSFIFPFFKNEINHQKKLEITLKKEEEKEKNLTQEKDELDKEVNKAFQPFFTRDPCLRDYRIQRLESFCYKKAISLFESIIQVFGGQEKFKQLPILDTKFYEKQIEEVGKKGGYEIKIQDISNLPGYFTALITHPMMRGTFQNGSEFFVIRAKNRENKFCYQIFYQDMSGQAPHWWYFCNTIIDVSKYSEYNMLIPTFCEVLEQFIKEGKNDHYTLE